VVCSNTRPARKDAVRLGLSIGTIYRVIARVVVAVGGLEVGRQRGLCQERYRELVSVPRALQRVG
jgi:hypothetical protein